MDLGELSENELIELVNSHLSECYRNDLKKLIKWYELSAPIEMMGLIGNNPMVGMTVAVAVAIEEASK